MDAMLALVGNLLADLGPVGVLSLIAACAALVTAYIAGRHLYLQSRHWLAEDARVAPIGRVLLSNDYSNDGWFHGVWEVTNRAPFKLELVGIEARKPRSLIIGKLDPSTDGPSAGMKVAAFGKVLQIERVIAVPHDSKKYASISDNFLYRLSNAPDKDRGRTIRLRFRLQEHDNPSRRYSRNVEAVIPTGAKQAK